MRFEAAYTLLRRSVRAFLDDRALDMAAAISFRVLLSLAPLVIFLVAAIGAVISWAGLRADLVADIVAAARCRRRGSRISASSWTRRCGARRRQD